jgi:hypothetical protein
MFIGAALDGWQLAAVVIVGLVVIGFLVVLVILREGKSRRVRVGVFVEREHLDPPLVEEDQSEWPTQH